MKKTSFSLHRWQRALVYGLGLSGVAASRLLRRHGIGVVGVDRRPLDQLGLAELADDPQVELQVGGEPDALPAVDGIVLSPGVPLDRPLVLAARRAGIPVIAEVELAAAFVEGPVVGITGSNGKSTTTALTGALLEASGLATEVCGNIGRPLSACVDGPADRVFVVELSSFQLETIRDFRAQAAGLLNLSADHLDRYESLQAYGDAKARLLATQLATDTAVVNADDPWVRTVATTARRRSFSRQTAVEDGCFVDGDRVVERAPGEPERELFRLEDLRLPGVHNLENAMAASLLATAVGGRRETFRQALSGFAGLPHRTQWIATIDGVAYYDDSKGTNPGATLRALDGFEAGTVHLILGGRAKGEGFDDLWPVVAARAARCYLIGEASELFASQLDSRGVDYETCGDLDRAVQSARRRATTGETVLLSPACASFDQYANFGARGDHFQALVRALQGGRRG